MDFLKPKLSALLFLFAFAIGCKKEDLKEPPIPVDLSQVKLNDFQLQEVNYVDFDVTHPTIVDGQETAHGEIRVVVTANTPSLTLTPRTSNFNDNAFTITPALGVAKNFLNSSNTYTITSKKDPAKQVHYDVTIIKASDPINSDIKVTSFTFEKSKNPALNANIQASKIMESLGTLGKIYVFVPVGTDFSQLTPTIQYQGAELLYHQDHTSPNPVLTPYPANGKKIDFAYPKYFYLQVKSGQDIKQYDVVVDVPNPLKFNNIVSTSNDVAAGTDKIITVGTFTNQGNHPIRLKSVQYSDVVPTGLNVVSSFLRYPTNGLEPNKTGEVDVLLKGKLFPPGSYKATAAYTPRLNNDYNNDVALESAQVVINSRIL